MSDRKTIEIDPKLQIALQRMSHNLELDTKKRTWKFKLLEPYHNDQETLMKNRKLKSIIYWYDQVNNCLDGVARATYQATAEQMKAVLSFNRSVAASFEITSCDDEWRNAIKFYRSKVGSVLIKDQKNY
jgi:hypothetical protein